MSQLYRRPLLLAGLLCCILLASVASAQKVVINGVPLVTSRSPVTMGGSMLLPMRDVFEALQAEIKWFASEQKIVAVRGLTIIELWIGRPTATLNGQPMNLPIAPTLIGGSTYVPLRFPAEAFGGTVKWEAATATAFIDIPQGTSDGASSPPATPETPKERQVDGSVIQIVPNPAGLVLQTNDTASGLVVVALQAQTVLTRGVAGAAAQPATLADVRVGDYAQATLTQGNVAVRVALSYGIATGKIMAIAQNSLFLDTGTAYQLAEQPRILDASGTSVSLSAIAANTPAQIFFEPRSKQVYEIRLTGAPLPTPDGQKPQILTVGLLNNTSYFKRGDTIRARVTGTPGGQATISLGRLAKDLAMREVQPGTYETSYVVPESPEFNEMFITGYLSVNGVAAPPQRAQTRLTIDNTPPVINGVLPANGAAVNNVSPTIQVLLTPQTKGAPVDPRSAFMSVNGRTVSTDLSVNEDDLTYFAQDLPRGAVQVAASIRDRAGNQAQVNWTFTIGGTTDAALQSVWHDARGVLMAGDIITVNTRVLTPGGTANFALGNLRTNIPMTRVNATTTYRGTYTVRAGDTLPNGLVTVTYRDPQGRQGTLEAVTRVNINTTLPNALRITAPLDQGKVADVIQVAGTARPRSSVRVTIGYTGRLLTTFTGQLWTGVVTTAANGTWETPEIGSSIGFLGRADTYTIKAEQLDVNGATTTQQQITLRK